MSNFLGPSYDDSNINDFEGLYGPSLIFQNPYSTFDANLGLKDNSARTQLGAQFLTNAAGNLTAIDVFMLMFGAPSGTMTMDVYASVANVPSGATLGTSDTVDVDTVSASTWTRVRFEFATPVALSPGINYFFALSASFAVSGTNYIALANDTGPTLSQRNATYNGSVWATSTSLLCYEAYVLDQTVVAQSFIASGNQELDSVILYLKKAGTPTGNLQVELYNDITGSPSTTGPDNNVSDVVAANTLTTSEEPITFTFSTPPELVDGLRYHIVLRNSGVLSLTDNVLIGVDNTSPTFTGNQFNRQNRDLTWYEYEEVDAPFEVYYVDQALPTTLETELLALGYPPADCGLQQEWLTQLINTLSTFFPTITPEIYGGTGTGVYNKGDILYASSPYHLEKLSIGVAGQNLAVQLDGIPGWGGPGNSVIQSYYNDTGLQLDPYDLVIHDNANPSYVKLTTEENHPDLAGVVQDIIPTGQWGPVLTHGITKARINGIVSAGDSVITSTTSRRGVAQDGTIPGSIFALSSGIAGDAIDVFVNISHLRQPSFGYWETSGGGLGSTTYTAVAGSLISLYIYTGRVLISYQGTVQNASAASGSPALNVYVDGVLLSLSGSNADLWKGAVASNAGNGFKQNAQFTWPIEGLSGGLHTFELASKQSAGSWNFQGQPQENSNNGTGSSRGLFSVREF
jgi:hypothetical protein